MNLTEAIEQDNARREENEQRETLRNLVSENPFSKEHWNVTRQISAKLANPELADLLDKCKGVTLPTCIVDDPPADLMAALKEFAASVTKANATISGNGTGEA